ncbi:hypothetical protein [Halovibrio variabilis]|uniref:hypothetical protein n=1 Tax=Halovibrio variabilis TaxID=31910 RepID=UPI0011BF6F7F|nr:hypothetical protein [Halovibrio variabilis]
MKVFVARRKRQRTRDGGPARAQRATVPGFGCGAIGRRTAATRGCLKRSRNSHSRYHALRVHAQS